MAEESVTPPSPEPVIEEGEDAAGTDLPLTMAASVVLEHLPRDARRALETAGQLEQEKVIVRVSPLPGTPQLRQPRFKCPSNERFESIVRSIRRKLALKDHESLFCYVNSVFAPGLDEGVGNLWRCFKTGEELVISYGVTQAFG